MKTLFSILTLLSVAFGAHAQQGGGFVTGPSRFNLLTNQTTWMNVSSNGGTVAANMPLTQAPWVQVGGIGFGVGIKAYATNAALTTNVWFTIALSADGVNEITNTSLSVVYLPRGTATNTYYTNFVLNTSATLGNIVAARVKNVMSTNGEVGSALSGNLFVEKFYLNTR